MNFAFAVVDPVSYQVIPSDPDDIILYPDFTALKSRTLQTWIALGGFAYNDPGPTHTTFSDMVSTAANRAVFIKSILNFMRRWGFQGVE